VPDIRLSKEDEEKVNKAIFLLNEAKELLPKKDLASLARELVVKKQISSLDGRIKLLAQQRIDGGGRVEVVANPKRIQAQWEDFVHDVEESKWNDKAMESARETFAGIGHFQDEVQNLIDAANKGKALNIDIVDKISASVAKTLGPVKDNLRIAHDKALEESMALPRVMDLIKAVEERQAVVPDNIQEVFSKQREWAEAVQIVLNAERDMVRAMERANSIAESSLAKIENSLLAMASAAVTWRKQKDFNEAVDFLSNLSQGALAGAQALAGEPIAHATLQGLHMLIKGIGDGTKIVVAGIKAGNLSKKGVDAVVDMIEADDFAQMKLDGIKMALEWVAEPLGFIPNVGAMIRGIINGITGQIIGILKEAVTAQKEQREEEKKKGLKPGSTFKSKPYEDQIMEAIKAAFSLKALEDSLKEALKWDLEEGVETMKSMADVALGTAADPGTAIAKMATTLAMAVASGPITAAVAKIVPAIGLVDKDDIKQTLGDARASVAELKTTVFDMEAIDRSFGFDESASKSMSTQVVKGLPVGVEGTTVWVARSPVFKETAGVAVMINPSGHLDENKLFMNSLVQDATQEGFEGTVMTTGTVKDGKVKDLKLQFDFDDRLAHAIVRAYVKACGGSSSAGSARGSTITWKTGDHCWN
jgi:hypothetical protein